MIPHISQIEEDTLEINEQIITGRIISGFSRGTILICAMCFWRTCGEVSRAEIFNKIQEKLHCDACLPWVRRSRKRAAHREHHIGERHKAPESMRFLSVSALLGNPSVGFVQGLQSLLAYFQESCAIRILSLPRVAFTSPTQGHHTRLLGISIHFHIHHKDWQVERRSLTFVA